MSRSACTAALVLALLVGCGRSGPVPLPQIVEFKLSVPITSIGIDLTIQLPEEAQLVGGDIYRRAWETRLFRVDVTSNQEQIKTSFEAPCSPYRVVPERGRAAITSRKDLKDGALWICEIRDQMDVVEDFWAVRLVRNVSELIECSVGLGPTPTERTRAAAAAICESLQVRGRSDFTQNDDMERTDTTRTMTHTP